jgi:hypothetical protein
MQRTKKKARVVGTIEPRSAHERLSLSLMATVAVGAKHFRQQPEILDRSRLGIMNLWRLNARLAQRNSAGGVLNGRFQVVRQRFVRRTISVVSH